MQTDENDKVTVIWSKNDSLDTQGYRLYVYRPYVPNSEVCFDIQVEPGDYDLCIQGTEVIDGVRMKGEKSPVTVITVLPQDRGKMVPIEYEIIF